MRNAWVWVGIFALFFATDVSAKKKKVKVGIGSVVPSGTPWERQGQWMKKNVRKRSGGSVKIKLYFDGRKGDEGELLKKCTIDDPKLQGIAVSSAAAANAVPEIQAWDLPFLFDSNAEIDFVLDNYLYAPFKQVMEKYNLIFYVFGENGWLNVGMTDGFVKTPADVAGRKMRTPKSLIYEETWKAMGAQPVVLGTSEVLPALLDGKVVGFAQTPLLSFATAWHTKIGYYTLTKHVYQPGLVAYCKGWFKDQAPQTKEILMSDVKEATDFGRESVRKLGPQLLENFKTYGIKMYTLTEAERSVFKKATKDVKAKFKASASPGALKLLKAIETGKAAFKKR